MTLPNTPRETSPKQASKWTGRGLALVAAMGAMAVMLTLPAHIPRTTEGVDGLLVAIRIFEIMDGTKRTPFPVNFLWTFWSAQVAAMLLGCIAVLVVSARARPHSPVHLRATGPLHWTQLAYLAGGSSRLATAVLADLIQRGHARIGRADDKKAVMRLEQRSALLTREDHAVLALLPTVIYGLGARRDAYQVRMGFKAITLPLINTMLNERLLRYRRHVVCAASVYWWPLVAVTVIMVGFRYLGAGKLGASEASTLAMATLPALFINIFLARFVLEHDTWLPQSTRRGRQQLATAKANIQAERVAALSMAPPRPIPAGPFVATLGTAALTGWQYEGLADFDKLLTATMRRATTATVSRNEGYREEEPDGDGSGDRGDSGDSGGGGGDGGGGD